MASILSRVTFPYAGRWVWTALAMMTLLNVISQVSLYGLVREQEAARNREYCKRVSISLLFTPKGIIK